MHSDATSQGGGWWQRACCGSHRERARRHAAHVAARAAIDEGKTGRGSSGRCCPAGRRGRRARTACSKTTQRRRRPRRREELRSVNRPRCERCKPPSSLSSSCAGAPSEAAASSSTRSETTVSLQLCFADGQQPTSFSAGAPPRHRPPGAAADAARLAAYACADLLERARARRRRPRPPPRRRRRRSASAGARRLRRRGLRLSPRVGRRRRAAAQRSGGGARAGRRGGPARRRRRSVRGRRQGAARRAPLRVCGVAGGDVWRRGGLCAGVGVLDIAGGRGGVAFELSCRRGIPTTLVEPRDLQLDRRARRFVRKAGVAPLAHVRAARRRV